MTEPQVIATYIEPLGMGMDTNCPPLPLLNVLPETRVDRGFDYAVARYRPLLCGLGDAPVDSTPPGG